MKSVKLKRLLALVMAMVLAVSLAACGGGGGESSDSGEGKKGLKLALVFSSGGLGDKNMNDMSYEAMLKAEKELGISFDYVVPTTDSDIEMAARLYVEDGSYDCIFFIASPTGEACKNLAAEFPDQKMVWVDGDVDLPNVCSISTIWPEQTFLCGVIAGLGTLSDMEKANSDNVVGCVLAQEIPFLISGTIGFEAGAKYVNPDVEVLHATIGSFTDPATGKEIAISMYERGADFIQHIAGGSGLGVFNAAVEKDRYAFGVGSNQNEVEPDHIVATSLKDVKTIVYNQVKALIDGTWKPGLMMIGMKNGGTGYTTENSNVKIPQEIIDKVEDIKKMVVDGKLSIPSTREEMEEWLKTNHYDK